MTDAELRDAAVKELELTTVGYKNSKWTTPPAGTHWKAGLDLLAQVGGSSSWVVAPPENPVTTINNPVGAGVNVYQGRQTVTDTVVNGGQDQAFLTQGGQSGGAGSVFQRIQGNAVGGYSTSGNNKHFFYVKAANVTVLDASASAATSPHTGDGGLSVRYAGFLGQRFTLDGFQLPLCIFADDEVPGTVRWTQGKITNPRNTPVYLDCDEAAKMVYDVVVDQVDVVGASPSLKFCAVNPATFAGSVTISKCTFNGAPVTAQMVQGVPADKLTIVA